MYRLKSWAIGIGAALAIFVPPVSAVAHGLEIESAVVSGTVTASNDRTAYLTIVNEGYHAEYLYGASTPLATRVELHRTRGQSEMVPVKRVEIPMSDQLDMRRAGYHLMLIGIKRPLRIGENIPVSLSFGDGRIQKTTLKVAGE
jgi:periplasmic copper chaperone A